MSLRISAAVKSSTNQPPTRVPSSVLTVRRPAYCGSSQTLVLVSVRLMTGLPLTRRMLPSGVQVDAGEHRLVAGEQRAVLGHHQVGLDVVRALRDGQLVGGQRVLGPVARRAAVADDDRRGAVQRAPALCVGGRNGHRRKGGEGDDGGREVHAGLSWGEEGSLVQERAC